MGRHGNLSASVFFLFYATTTEKKQLHFTVINLIVQLFCRQKNEQQNQQLFVAASIIPRKRSEEKELN